MPNIREYIDGWNLNDWQDLLTSETLYLLLTSFLSLLQVETPFLPVLNLAVLIRSVSDKPLRGGLKPFLTLLGGSAAGSLVTHWDLLPTTGQVLVAQGTVSSVLAGVVMTVVLAHQRVLRQLDRGSHWSLSWIFGTLWATAWWAYSSNSPLGVYGIPVLTGLPGSSWVLRYLGPPGVDILTGVVAYELSTYLDLAINLIGDAEKSHQVDQAQYQVFETQGGVSKTDLGFGRRLKDADEPSIASDILIESEYSCSILGDGSTSSATSATQDYSQEGAETGLRLLQAKVRTRSTTPSPLTTHTSSKVSGWTVAILVSALAVLHPRSNLPLSGPISTTTTLTVACLLPPGDDPLLVDYLAEAKHAANQAKLLVMPEGAVSAWYEGERTWSIDLFLEQVGEQSGAWTLLSLESVEDKEDDKVKNEAILIGPHGVQGAYAKQHLFPWLESRSRSAGAETAPVCTMNLATPKGVHKDDWADGIGHHVRQVGLTPAICLDALHDPGSEHYSPPASFLVVPTLDSAGLADEVIRHTRRLSIIHALPSIVCSRARSAAFDAWGEVLYYQTGARTFQVTFALPWDQASQSHSRQWRTPYEILGSRYMLGIAWIVVVGKPVGRICTDFGRLIEAVKGAGTRLVGGVRKLLGWSSEESAV